MINALTCQRTLDVAVHSFGGEVVGAVAEFGDGGADVFGFAVFQTALQ